MHVKYTTFLLQTAYLYCSNDICIIFYTKFFIRQNINSFHVLSQLTIHKNPDAVMKMSFQRLASIPTHQTSPWSLRRLTPMPQTWSRLITPKRIKPWWPRFRTEVMLSWGRRDPPNATVNQESLDLRVLPGPRLVNFFYFFAFKIQCCGTWLYFCVCS